MKIALQFSPRADLSNRVEILRSCLTHAERRTARWLDERVLEYSTDRELSDVATAWESQGFWFREFQSVRIDSVPTTRVRSIVMPAGLDIPPHADRLVGREHDSLTETENRVHEHFSLYGELYFADYHDDGLVDTDVGHPGERITIRVPVGTSAYDAAWELARVVDFVLNCM